MRSLADFGTPMLIGVGFRTFPVTIFNEFISELSTAILLYTGRTKTLTVEIYTQIIRGSYGIAAALLIFNKVSGSSEISM
jgi:iron(III) transport system permease protein